MTAKLIQPFRAPLRLPFLGGFVVELLLIRHGFENQPHPLERQADGDDARVLGRVHRVHVLRVPHHRRTHHRVQRRAQRDDECLLGETLRVRLRRVLRAFSPLVPRHASIKQKRRQPRAVRRAARDVQREHRRHERPARDECLMHERRSEQNAQSVSDAERVDGVDVRQRHRGRARRPKRGQGVVRAQNRRHRRQRVRGDRTARRLVMLTCHRRRLNARARETARRVGGVATRADARARCVARVGGDARVRGDTARDRERHGVVE